MSIARHRALVSLLALFVLILPLVALAQETPIRIDGSRIVADIVEPLSNAYQETNDVAVSLEISGTSSGLSRLCNGEIDIAAAARPITRAEEQACADGGVDWVEVLLGYDALAVIANPAIAAAQCMTFGELTTLLGAAATNSITNLNQVNPLWPDSPVTLYSPGTATTTYDLLTTLLPGDGLRTDLNIQDDPGAVVGSVIADPTGIGIAPLGSVPAGGDEEDAGFRIVELDNLSGLGCVAPSQTALEDGSYPAARGLYLYVNSASLENEHVRGLVDWMLTAEARDSVAEKGFVATSDDLAAQIQANVAEGVVGRQLSQPEPAYTIPLDVSGAVQAEASALAYAPINQLISAFTESYDRISVTLGGHGNAAAYRKLCGGEADIIAVDRPATAGELATCEAGGISLWEATPGNQALVVVVPAAADYAACLTTDQIATLWKSHADEAITNWNQLGNDFPDLPVTIFLPSNSQSVTGTLLYYASDDLLEARRDALQTNNDPLWRAAATANVEGSVTYMSYLDFLRTDANVIAVAVDAGNGCVEPGLETIRDGSYALSNPLMLAVNQAALARPEVQAVLWSLMRNTDQYSARGVIAADEAQFQSYQEQLPEAFAAAAAAASAPAPTAEPAEATPAPDAEAATVEPTPAPASN